MYTPVILWAGFRVMLFDRFICKEKPHANTRGLSNAQNYIQARQAEYKIKSDAAIHFYIFASFRAFLFCQLVHPRPNWLFAQLGKDKGISDAKFNTHPHFRKRLVSDQDSPFFKRFPI